MIEWIINLLPWWFWLGLAAAVVGVVWRVWGWQGAVAAAAGLVAVLGYGKGRSDAYRDEQERTAKRNLEAAKRRKEIDDEVDQLGSNDLDSAYRRWLRDHDDG